jgi:hypothetical protein
MNVWVGDVARSLDSARAITHDTQRGIMHFAWTRDSRYMLFEQDRAAMKTSICFASIRFIPTPRRLISCQWRVLGSK